MSQTAIKGSTSRMKRALTKTISGTMIAATSAANASTSNWWRLILRRSPSYSSGGIWPVFHARPQVSQRQRSP